MWEVLKELQSFINDETGLTVFINYIPSENQNDESCLIQEAEVEFEKEDNLCGGGFENKSIVIRYFSDVQEKKQPKYYDFNKKLKKSFENYFKNVGEIQIVNAELTDAPFQGIEQASKALVYEATLTLGIYN